MSAASQIYEIVRTDDGYRHVPVHEPRSSLSFPVYETLTTPGHGYLKVPNCKLREYGITRKVSHSSFIGRTESSLEEDCDYGVLVDAVLDAGHRFYYMNRYVEHANRGMRRYHPYFAEHPIGEGSTVTLRDGRHGLIRSLGRTDTEIELAIGVSIWAKTRTLLNVLQPTSMSGYVITHPDHGVLIGYNFPATVGEPNIPRWSNHDTDLPPWAMLHQTEETARKYLVSAGVSDELAAGCRIVAVKEDPWKSSWVGLDILAAAGVPAWQPSERYLESEVEYVRFEERGTTSTFIYDRRPDGFKGMAVHEHTVRIPGDYIVVPELFVSGLPGNLSCRAMSDGVTVFLPWSSLRDYVRYLHRHKIGFGFKRTWHDDVLWLTRLFQHAETVRRSA